MPLYEYRCTQCGYRYERIQKFDAEPDAICPKCGGELQRPLTAPALQFKGAGWYVNDYAPKAASGSAEKSPSDTSSDAKPTTESKPAAESKAAPAESPAKPSSTTGASTG